MIFVFVILNVDVGFIDKIVVVGFDNCVVDGEVVVDIFIVVFVVS